LERGVKIMMGAINRIRLQILILNCDTSQLRHDGIKHLGTGNMKRKLKYENANDIGNNDPALQ
jgi:hypothetical protein